MRLAVAAGRRHSAARFHRLLRAVSAAASERGELAVARSSGARPLDEHGGRLEVWVVLVALPLEELALRGGERAPRRLRARAPQVRGGERGP